jgi:hypothetical protein
MRIIKLLLLSFLAFPFSTMAQLSINNGSHSLEITGGVTTFYNHRFYPKTATDLKKNRFGLRDAQLQLEGRIGTKYEYEFQADFADIFSTINDAENPGLMDANFTYKGLKYVEIKTGYQKINYSRSSMVPFIYSPFFQRAEMVRGELFSRRDVGVTLQSSILKQLVNIYGGVYSGLGETILKGDNDASGKPEYAGRVDLAYPSRFRYNDIDSRDTPIPMFVIGANARYAEKNVSLGEDFQIKTVAGKKSLYGMDMAFQYRGFSAQYEIHQMKAYPTSTRPLLGYDTDYLRAGGYAIHANYFSKKLKSLVAIRYDEFNPTDLVVGNTMNTISYAFNYFINGSNSVIKVQYWQRLKQDNINTQWNDDQIRVGWVLLFK